MKKTALIGTVLSIALLSSCVSKKKFTELQDKNKSTMVQMGQTSGQLITCEKEKIEALTRIRGLEEQLAFLQKTNDNLLKNNSDMIQNVGNMTTLTKKGAENLEKSLESIKEKDTRITSLQDALTKKDSVTIAIVTSLKSSLGNLNDTDIEINVEKGVVYISIADKLLFNSGSYVVSDKAKVVLGKVATVVKAKPDFEVMVEGHTDNVQVIQKDNLIDNWDLSVKRATSVVRVLQNDFNIEPGRIIAAGRAEYVPLVANNSTENKAKNRRTRILVLPKIDQFYKMVEDGMKQAK